MMDNPGGDATTAASAAVNTGGAVIFYELVDEGTHRSVSFQKYRAVTETKHGSITSNTTRRNPISFADWARGMASEVNALAMTSVLAASCPFKAAFWETPAVLPSQMHTKEMEFVLMDAPQLHHFASRNGPDESAFAEHFASTCQAFQVGCIFESLGRDAILVSPKPKKYQRQQLPADLIASKEATTASTNPSHLLSYLRTAPMSELHELWKLVGETWLETMQSRKGQRRRDDDDDPVWLSTSGMGIAYLHFRLDRRPKYYTYDPYKTPS
jgi:hypothetical protein